MILDQVFFGVLNESEGTLEVYDEPIEDVSDFSVYTKSSTDVAAITYDSSRHYQTDGRCGQKLVRQGELAISADRAVANGQASGV